MVIVEAGEARLYVKLNNQALIKENIDLVLAKEEVWHQIKRACIKGEYQTVVEIKDGEIATAIQTIFKGYGYNVNINDNKVYIDWSKK